MFEYKPLHYYPSSEELPDSDDTPVDNELQDLIPGLLKAILGYLWVDRWDWFFGVDMGVYYDPEEAAIVPDGFLSLGVERFIDEDLRLSYPLWEEGVVPIFALEVVSQTYRGEYSTKKLKYQEMGVLYYVVYSSRRRRKPPLEVYKLVNGEYVLLSTQSPCWMPEIGLGIGRDRAIYLGIEREWVFWYDEQGNRYLLPDERTAEAQRRAEESERRELELQQQLDRLREQLRSRGIDLDEL
jgi:Uma2 family endonuclease